MSVSFVDVNASCEFYSLFSPGIILWCVCRGCFSQSGSSEQHLPNHGLSLSTRWQRGYVCQTHTQYIKNLHSFLVRKVEDVCLKPACFFLKRPIGPSSSGHIKKKVWLYRNLQCLSATWISDVRKKSFCVFHCSCFFHAFWKSSLKTERWKLENTHKNVT